MYFTRPSPRSCRLRGALELPLDYLQTTEKQLHDMVRPLHLHVISVAKKTNLFVFHFFRRTDITPQLLHSVESYLMNIFSPVRNFHFAVGTPVCGIRKIYDSYSAAVIALQSTFFFEPGTCLDPERLSGLTGPDEEMLRLISALHARSLCPLEDIASEAGLTAGYISEHIKKYCGREACMILWQTRQQICTISQQNAVMRT